MCKWFFRVWRLAPFHWRIWRRRVWRWWGVNTYAMAVDDLFDQQELFKAEAGLALAEVVEKSLRSDVEK